MIPSTFHPVACSTSAAIRTAVVVSTSFLLSAAVASRVVESILFPIRVLKIIISAFTRIDAIRTIIESRENSTVTGWSTFSKELFASSNPINKIITATVRLARYSNLACPYGCSLSAGFSASLNPVSVTIELAASDRLFNPSAVIDMEPASFPTASLLPARQTLHTIPTRPDSFPSVARFAESFFCFISFTSIF